MITDFKDKVAVITGAACGIGMSLAHSFAQRGMKLALIDINEEKLKELADNLRSKGTEVLELVIDVSEMKQVSQMADDIYDHFGKVHILCNNAGVTLGGPAHLLSPSDWQWVLSVNLLGIVNGVNAFLPRMFEAGEPCHIVNTASLAGLLAEPTGGPYTASKFAIVGFTECLVNQYFNSNINFAVLCPAAVKTKIHINSLKLGKDKSTVYSSDGVKREEFKGFIDGMGSVIESGIDPKIVSEMVVEAISKDIFYIVTHPEYLPLIEARMYGIKADIMALNKEPAKKIEDIYTNNELTVYKKSDPNFTMTYPKNWQTIPLPPGIPIILMAGTFEHNLSILVMDMIPNMELKNVININTTFLSNIGNEVKIISNAETKLKDGKTIAYEGLIEYKQSGLIRSKTMTLSVFKDNKIISITVGYLPHTYSENLKKILYSLEF